MQADGCAQFWSSTVPSRMPPGFHPRHWPEQPHRPRLALYQRHSPGYPQGSLATAPSLERTWTRPPQAQHEGLHSPLQQECIPSPPVGRTNSAGCRKKGLLPVQPGSTEEYWV